MEQPVGRLTHLWTIARHEKQDKETQRLTEDSIKTGMVHGASYLEQLSKNLPHAKKLILVVAASPLDRAVETSEAWSEGAKRKAKELGLKLAVVFANNSGERHLAVEGISEKAKRARTKLLDSMERRSSYKQYLAEKHGDDVVDLFDSWNEGKVSGEVMETPEEVMKRVEKVLPVTEALAFRRLASGAVVVPIGFSHSGGKTKNGSRPVGGVIEKMIESATGLKLQGFENGEHASAYLDENGEKWVLNKGMWLKTKK